MITNQISPSYTPPQGETVVRETTTVEKEYDSKGRVTKETTVTEKETITNAMPPYTPYNPTWTTNSLHPLTIDGIKYGSADKKFE